MVHKLRRQTTLGYFGYSTIEGSSLSVSTRNSSSEKAPHRIRSYSVAAMFPVDPEIEATKFREAPISAFGHSRAVRSPHQNRPALSYVRKELTLGYLPFSPRRRGNTHKSVKETSRSAYKPATDNIEGQQGSATCLNRYMIQLVD
jgi:hypothetical protein